MNSSKAERGRRVRVAGGGWRVRVACAGGVCGVWGVRWAFVVCVLGMGVKRGDHLESPDTCLGLLFLFTS